MTRPNFKFLVLLLIFATAVSSETYTVFVSNDDGDDVYEPKFTKNLNPGDTINFVWNDGPHSVTQSDEEGSCTASTSRREISPPRSSGSVAFTMPDHDVYFFCSV
ncbi:1619_t:CDS:2, partial [Gigaspora margarita]